MMHPNLGRLQTLHAAPCCAVLPPQALCVATLGSESDAQRIDGIRSDVSTPDSSSDEDSGNAASSLSYERFYLQYFFPPSSVGECGRVGPAGELQAVAGV